MAKKLYVGNLSYNTDSSMLGEMFSSHGTVTSAEIIADRETGRSKGFGFVEMSTDAEMNTALTAMSGKEIDGRTITVNEAKPREPRAGGSGGGGSRPSAGGSTRGSRY